MLRFFLISVPVFLIVYTSTMSIMAIKDLVKKYRW